MTRSGIEVLKNAWVASVRRAVECGFDVIEIHNAQYVNSPGLVVDFLTALPVATFCTLSVRQQATTVLMSMGVALRTAYVFQLKSWS